MTYGGAASPAVRREGERRNFLGYSECEKGKTREYLLGTAETRQLSEVMELEETTPFMCISLIKGV